MHNQAMALPLRRCKSFAVMQLNSIHSSTWLRAGDQQAIAACQPFFIKQVDVHFAMTDVTPYEVHPAAKILPVSATPEARIWFLRHTPIFEDQSESMYESVGSRSEFLEFDRGDLLPTIVNTRAVIYVLESGQVKLRSQTDTGKEIILDVL